MKNLILAFSLFTFLIISCSEIPMELPEGGKIEFVPNGRIMLIEEYTGVKCGPCAGGALLLNEIADCANGAVVVYAIHGSFLSDPHTTSKYDFRYPDSQEMERAATSLPGKPSISYNRSAENGERLFQPDFTSWQPFIDKELTKLPVATLEVDVTFDRSSRKVEIVVTAGALETISGVVNLNLVVSESHLVDPQLNADSSVIPDFDHKHVMKESLSNLNGDFVIENFQSGDTKEIPYTYTLPDELNGEWIPENMEITAFLSSEDLDGEVLQAAQVHITE